MIYSMTGYGRAQEVIDGMEITAEIKSVNHRFFEFSARVPRIYGYLEEKIKSYLQTKIARGKIDVYITVLNLEGTDVNVEVNSEVAGAYVKALRSLSDKFDLNDDLSLSSIMRISDIFTVRKENPDEEHIWKSVLTVLEQATEKFLEMRSREGVRLREDILGRVDTILSLVSKVEEEAPKTVANYRDKLTQKINDILENKSIDEARIVTEAAIFAEKIAVDEETVRLRSHISQFKTLIEEKGAVGKKLDFLIQEFNRETNTIGSKAQNAEIAKIVVEIKSEIEKIREQIQNIE
ncbi:MAG: YicC family protein [Oscillospiraceae bacterium]|nr:YicC family protein [Oscillospiraceae bacterium]